METARARSWTVSEQATHLHTTVPLHDCPSATSWRSSRLLLCLLTRRPTCQSGLGEKSVWPDAGQTRAYDKLTSLGLFLPCVPCRNPSWKLGIVLACTPRTWEVEVGVQGNSQLHPQLELWATLPTQTKEVKSFPENKRIK